MDRAFSDKLVLLPAMVGASDSAVVTAGPVLLSVISAISFRLAELLTVQGWKW
jgi:hypothetical protein